MKTILIFVTSLDGKITKWGDPMIRAWTSDSDQKYFDEIWRETRVIIMGSGTYDPAPVRPDSSHFFIVITRQPEKYKDHSVSGKLEFTNEPPLNLISRFEKAGEEKILVVGGAHIATLFLKENLIDELWITIEPKIFGRGTSVVNNEELDIQLKLLSCTTANEQGTLLTKYKVVKEKLFE
jgi:dihydrofolate reductase